MLAAKDFSDLWEAYPFNSGYFMCLRIKQVEAEKVRTHLLDKYGVGTIAMDTQDLRITFSSMASQDIEDLFDTIAQAIRDLL